MTLLPATSFFLDIKYANAKGFLDKGVRVALATDFNPGTAPSYKLPFTLFLAASKLKMNPYEILCGVTYNGAIALRKGASAGTLSENKTADILCWNVDYKSTLHGEDSLENIILSQSDPFLVIQSGKCINEITLG